MATVQTKELEVAAHRWKKSVTLFNEIIFTFLVILVAVNQNVDSQRVEVFVPPPSGVYSALDNDNLNVNLRVPVSLFI